MNTPSGNIANAYFGVGSTLLTDKGRNCYQVVNVSSNYHIIGNYSEFEFLPFFNAGKNFWGGPSDPHVLFNTTVNFVYESPLISCPSWYNHEGIQIAGVEVTDMGGGISDTVHVSSIDEEGGGGGGSVSSENEDRYLYWQIISNKRQKNYSTGIQKAEELINNLDSSAFLLRAIDELYMCYHLTDSTGNQNNTNALFNGLKSYLEQKTTQYQNKAVIIEKIYHYYLKTLVKLRQFTEAIAGYENIMNNHPNPVARLNASWDRAAVVLLMNNSGGSYNELKIRNILKNDPHRTAKKIFRKSENNERISVTSQYTKKEKEIINERVMRFNPATIKELNEKVSADLTMLLGLQDNTQDNNKNTNIPKKFKLYQNYPNPFNPATTIKYDIPKDAFVTVRIYDILGREVFSQNDFRTAGSYEIKFDGSNYASGMYFYQIEAGNFKDTKKMVLIK